jgi:hypothetical protein
MQPCSRAHSVVFNFHKKLLFKGELCQFLILPLGTKYVPRGRDFVPRGKLCSQGRTLSLKEGKVGPRGKVVT